MKYFCGGSLGNSFDTEQIFPIRERSAAVAFEITSHADGEAHTVKNCNLVIKFGGIANRHLRAIQKPILNLEEPHRGREYLHELGTSAKNVTAGS